MRPPPPTLLLRPLLLALAASAALLEGAPVAAQQLTGRVVDGSDAQPLGGAYVVLLAGGEPVASTVTGVDGSFRIVGPAAGRYRVRADQLGYGRVEEVVEIPPPGTAARVVLRAMPQAIEIEGLTAEAERQCEIAPAVATQVARLWEEVTEAFQVAALVQERRSYGLRMERWDRTLDPETLEVLEEERRPMRGFQRSSPFNSLPAEELDEHGYIRSTADGSFDYFAPDARVLLSRRFQDAHCFGVTLDPPADGESDWVGIRFDPRDRDRPDVQGTLWIDGATLQPRRMDFTYTELPFPVGSRHVGGRVRFQRLPDGPWIVQEWRIRMPEVQAERYVAFGSADPRYRYSILHVLESGGRVVAARPLGGEEVVLGETGRLQGTARQEGRPAPGSLLSLEGTVFRSRADADGRFRISDVPPGRYRLAHSSPVLDSLGLGGAAEPVEVRPGETTEVDVELPGLATRLDEACIEPLAADGEGFVRGVVRRPDDPGASVGDALVELSWGAGWDVGSAGGLAVVREDRSTVLLPVGENGSWWACGVPAGVPIRLRARATPDSGPGAATTVTAADSEVVAVRLDAPGSAVAQRSDGGPDPDDAVSDTAPDASPDADLADELAELGVRREALGRRFAGPARLAGSADRSSDVLDLIGRLGMPGIRVIQLAEGPCVFSRRSQGTSLRRAPEAPVCARVVVDGLSTETRRLQGISPESVRGLAFLRPAEAGARFGGGTEGGVLVVWTR